MRRFLTSASFSPPRNPTINVVLPRKRKEVRRPEEEPSASAVPEALANALEAAGPLTLDRAGAVLDERV